MIRRAEKPPFSLFFWYAILTQNPPQEGILWQRKKNGISAGKKSQNVCENSAKSKKRIPAQFERLQSLQRLLPKVWRTVHVI